MEITSYLLGKKAGGSSKGLQVIVVEELPQAGEADVLYLVPKETEGENDTFDEYLYVNNNWEHIGSTDIDLSNYYDKDEIDEKLENIDLPIASSSQLGGIKVGSGLKIDNSTGILSNITGEIVLSLSGSMMQPATFDNNSTFNSYRTPGVYFIKNSASTYNGYVGITIIMAGYYANTYNQALIIFPGAGMNAIGSIAYRGLPASGTITEKFVNRSVRVVVPNVNVLQSGFENDNVVGKHLQLLYGTKYINDLTTTNKSSLVDAINEVNGKIGDINTILATLTTPSNNGGV